MNFFFKHTKKIARVRLTVVYFLIALMAIATPIYTLTAYAAVNPTTSSTDFSNSLLNGGISNYVTSPASGLAPGGGSNLVNTASGANLNGLGTQGLTNINSDATSLTSDLSKNPIYQTGNNFGNSYGTSLGTGVDYGGGGNAGGSSGCPGGGTPTPGGGGGCDYGGGGTGSGAAGAGTCASGLLASILGSIGFSIAGATFGKSTATAAKATAAGAVAGTANPVEVPVKAPEGLVQGAANALGSLGDTITNFFTAITQNKSLGIQEQGRVESFMSCIARSIARALIQQVVSSTINWVNSGFNGSPSFVSNPTQFFQQTADNAAGNYLQSSDLAFLCSPFSLQVKIAIAQSYNGANNSGNQCTLTGVANNLQGFMNNFQNGGWPAFISMTTNPANQPFGAYIQGSEGLNRAVAAATQNKQSQLALSGGFLDYQQQKNCKTYNSPQEVPSPGPNQSVTPITTAENTTWQLCDMVTVTPGKTISDSLSKSLGMNLDELNMAKSFDELISALITQLFQKVMGSGGLLGLGSNYGNSASDFSGGVNAIAALQNNMLANIPVYTQSANTVIGLYQQDINLVQPVLAESTAALACLQNANGYSSLTSDQQAFVTTNLPILQATTVQLSAYLASYQNQLTKANAALTTLSHYQDIAGSASGISDISAIAANFTADISASTFPDQSVINGANEDFGTLTSQIDNVNQTLPSIASQCQALGVPARGITGTPPTSTLTPAQIQSVLDLLTSYSASNATITNVQAVLNGESVTTPIPVSITTQQINAVIALLQSFNTTQSIVDNVTAVLNGQ